MFFYRYRNDCIDNTLHLDIKFVFLCTEMAEIWVLQVLMAAILKNGEDTKKSNPQYFSWIHWV